MAEVRDLTPLRDADGRRGRLPDRGAAAHRLPGRIRGGRRRSGRQPSGSTQPDLPVRLAVDRAAAATSCTRSPSAIAAADGGRRAGPDRAVRSAGSAARAASRPTWRCGSPPARAPASRLQMTDRPTEPMRAAGRLHARRCCVAAPRGATYPYELTAAAGRARRHVRRARPGRTAALVPVDRPPGKNRRASSPASVTHADAALPRGHDPGGAARRPDEGAGRASPSRSAPG